MNVENVRQQINAAISHFEEASPERVADALATVNAEETLTAVDQVQDMVSELLHDLGAVRLDAALQQACAADVGRSALQSALSGASHHQARQARGFAELLNDYYDQQAGRLNQLETPLHEAARYLQAAMEAIQRFDAAQDDILRSTDQGNAYQAGAINAATSYKDEVL